MRASTDDVIVYAYVSELGVYTAHDRDDFDGMTDAAPFQVGMGRTKVAALKDLREQYAEEA